MANIENEKSIFKQKKEEKVNSQLDDKEKGIIKQEENTKQNVKTKKDSKTKTLFMGSMFSLIVLLLSVSYTVTWTILFIIFLKDEYTSECDSIKKWNKALVVISIISITLHIISYTLQFIVTTKGEESSKSMTIVKYINTFRSCINYITGIVLLIGINVEYANLETSSTCGRLSVLNMIYIITEWTLIGFFICFVVLLCIFAIISKKMKDQLD